jgi:mRNA interferase RelE/StbE
MARMRHAIVLAPEALEDLRRLDAVHHTQVRTAMEKHLRYEPTKVRKSRIKRLHDVRGPGYRLRVGEIRIFYDVSGGVVEVLAVVPKSQAGKWLSEWGVAE